MTNIEMTFAKTFETWDIKLPPDAVEQKRPGSIRKAGWNIRYVFGENSLDYYATHRMTNDRHVRIHSDGRSEYLEAPQDFFVLPKDGDEEAIAKAKEEYYARNRAVYRKLKEKGLTD